MRLFPRPKSCIGQGRTSCIPQLSLEGEKTDSFLEIRSSACSTEKFGFNKQKFTLCGNSIQHTILLLIRCDLKWQYLSKKLSIYWSLNSSVSFVFLSPQVLIKYLFWSQAELPFDSQTLRKVDGLIDTN